MSRDVINEEVERVDARDTSNGTRRRSPQESQMNSGIQTDCSAVPGCCDAVVALQGNWVLNPHV